MINVPYRSRWSPFLQSLTQNQLIRVLLQREREEGWTSGRYDSFVLEMYLFCLSLCACSVPAVAAPQTEAATLEWECFFTADMMRKNSGCVCWRYCLKHTESNTFHNKLGRRLVWSYFCNYPVIVLHLQTEPPTNHSHYFQFCLPTAFGWFNSWKRCNSVKSKSNETAQQIKNWLCCRGVIQISREWEWRGRRCLKCSTSATNTHR